MGDYMEIIKIIIAVWSIYSVCILASCATHRPEISEPDRKPTPFVMGEEVDTPEAAKRGNY